MTVLRPSHSAAYISLRDVGVEFPIYQGGSRSLKKDLLWRGTGGAVASDAHQRLVVRALDDINLDLAHGDRVGLIGHNGAGKTTLLRVLAGVYEPIRGTVKLSGRVCPLFDVGFGLDHDASGRDNILIRGVLLGVRPHDMRELIHEIAEFTELGAYIDMPIRTYSTGMLLRLAFAISTSVHPEILLMDEAMLAGDAHFLDKARRRLDEIIDRTSILVLASHSEDLLRKWCNKAIHMRAGRIVRFGPVDEMLEAYHRGDV